MLLGTRYGNAKYVESVPVNRDIQVKLDDTNLQKVSFIKFLGVIIDENLTWKNHIDGISKTIARNVGVLNKLKCYIPKRVLHSLYCTLILLYVNSYGETRIRVIWTRYLNFKNGRCELFQIVTTEATPLHYFKV